VPLLTYSGVALIDTGKAQAFSCNCTSKANCSSGQVCADDCHDPNHAAGTCRQCVGGTCC
jgi:hypothetical protein